MSDPLESLLVKSTETPFQAVTRVVQSARGLSDTDRVALARDMDAIVTAALADLRGQLAAAGTREAAMRGLLARALPYINTDDSMNQQQYDESTAVYNEIAALAAQPAVGADEGETK